jgi:hypothetical protein
MINFYQLYKKNFVGEVEAQVKNCGESFINVEKTVKLKGPKLSSYTQSVRTGLSFFSHSYIRLLNCVVD